jgi:hypothetical protein
MTTATIDVDLLPLNEVPPGLVDARPVLPRGGDNIWERIEERRSQIAAAIQEGFHARGIEALVLESRPYVHPAWVQCECWVPLDGRTLTSRASMKVTLQAVPFHRFDTIYKLEWTRQGRSAEIDHIYRLGLDQKDFNAALDLLCTPPSTSVELSDPVVKYFRKHQLRLVGWHFWKPLNKLTAIRPEWERVVSLLSLGLGVLVLFLAFMTGMANAGYSIKEDSGDARMASVDDLRSSRIAATEPLATERRHSPWTATAVNQSQRNTREFRPGGFMARKEGFAPARAVADDVAPATSSPYRLVSRADAAQEAQTPTLQRGSTHYGDLDANDGSLGDGRYWEPLEYYAQSGEHLSIQMTADSFDPLISIGQWDASGNYIELTYANYYSTGMAETLDYTAPTAGTYVIVASSAGFGTGSFTLLLSLPADSTDMAGQTPVPFTPDFQASEPTQSGATFWILGALLFLGGIAGAMFTARAPRYVRSPGKPLAEPRFLRYLDSWQTVIFGAGTDVEEVKRRLLSIFGDAHQQRFRCGTERIWYWGLDTKVEREQIVLRYGRALVFCQVYSYGSDLYVGWDAQLNYGTWIEKKIGRGVERATGKRVELMTVEHAVQELSDYDLVDLNCLAEWTHAQVTQVLKHYVKEREIDQEIDFQIIRGERSGILPNDDKQKKQEQRTTRFQRTA